MKLKSQNDKTHYPASQPESKRSTALTAAAKKKGQSAEERKLGPAARQPGPATAERKNERGGEQELREKNEKEKLKM